MNALASSIARTRRLTGLPALWLERIAMRERLGAMPERLLADVGLDPVAVAREVRRPFWRPLGERLAPGAPPVRAASAPRTPLAVPAALRPVARLASATFPTLS